MIVVYYDGKCGICNKEIRYYKRIAKKGIFEWFDIASDPAPLKVYNISQSQALRRLHAIDDVGNLRVGVDAFILIWSNLFYWKPLALIISIPLLKVIAKMIYNKFADYRFRKLKHCQISK